MFFFLYFLSIVGIFGGAVIFGMMVAHEPEDDKKLFLSILGIVSSTGLLSFYLLGEQQLLFASISLFPTTALLLSLLVSAIFQNRRIDAWYQRRLETAEKTKLMAEYGFDTTSMSLADARDYIKKEKLAQSPVVCQLLHKLRISMKKWRPYCLSVACRAAIEAGLITTKQQLNTCLATESAASLKSQRL